MRILYLANVRLPTERAHGVQIMKMCEAFALLGHAVELFIPRTFNHLTEDPFDWYAVKRVFRLRTVPSFDWRQADRIGLMPIAFRLQAFYFLFAAIAVALFSRPDIVYTRQLFLGALLSGCGVPVAFEDHEPPRGGRRFYIFLLRRLRRIVVVPRMLAERYGEWGIRKERYLFAPNGVDPTEFDNLIPSPGRWGKVLPSAEDLPIILYVGHFYRWKGVYILVEAARRLEGKAVVVLLGGTVENIQEMRDYLLKEGISNVYPLSFVPRREVLQYMKSADALVLPNTAKEERSALYTTPIKLFEYMASGVPIVASDIPSFHSYLRDGENALLFSADDSHDLAEKISILGESRELGKRLARQARLDSEAYSWQERAKQIIHFLTNEN